MGYLETISLMLLVTFIGYGVLVKNFYRQHL